jgi:uncharacterized protein (TIGR01777 family)
MRILIAGAGGTLGTALRFWFTAQGHHVLSLVRHPAQLPTQLQWDPYSTAPITARAQLARLENFDVAIHLSGEDIAAGRWTRDRKQVLRDSRIQTLHALKTVLSSVTHRPATLLSASGINYFGNRGDTPLNEQSLHGSGFLAQLALDWESAALSLALLNIRVVPMRFGTILTPSGGMLKKLLPVFRLGLGGQLGPTGPFSDALQYMSWISITDACRIAEFLIHTPALSGPVNATSPNPITNAAFTHSLAAAVHRKTFLPVPAFALRLAFGEMADELLLSSVRALPARLTAAGFHFLHPDLDTALAALLQK